MKTSKIVSSKISSNIILIVISSIIILTVAIIISLYISIQLNIFSTFINTSGKIRGGIQRTTKLYLVDKLISSEINKIDMLFYTFDNYKKSYIADAQINSIDSYLRLRENWKSFRVEIDNKSISKNEAVTKSEVIWNLSNDFVYAIEKKTHSYVRVLFYISMLTIIVIFLLLLSIVIVKYFIQNKIEKQASFDNLTGLLNRNNLEALYKKKISQINNSIENFAVLICDIDHFKNVNDKFGHDVGDIVLKGIANAIKNCTRDSDIVFRYGGEEFLIFALYRNISELIKYAERLREIIENEKYIEEIVTISIGVALVKDKQSMRNIIIQADSALYHAKETGRNKVVLYENLTTAST